MQRFVFKNNSYSLNTLHNRVHKFDYNFFFFSETILPLTNLNKYLTTDINANTSNKTKLNITTNTSKL